MRARGQTLTDTTTWYKTVYDADGNPGTVRITSDAHTHNFVNDECTLCGMESPSESDKSDSKKR